MAKLLVPLPELSEADPTVSGEGSLDPLGLAQVADRLAEHLLPGVRARMRRIRFLTASAVGALAAEDLFDTVPADGVSSPSICFEWLVLEAFERRRADGAPLEASGVPGSAKVRLVLAEGKRLAARNYLKSPNVFGFTGVYLPLARHLRVLDEYRRPAARITDLTLAWEQDQGFVGFTDGTQKSPGGKLRSTLRSQILEGLLKSHCAANESTGLWGQLTESLHPLRAGPLERVQLADWLTSADEPVRAEVARVIGAQHDGGDADLVALLLSERRSEELYVRLRAISSYEAVARLLDTAFRQLRWISTSLGVVPLSANNLSDDSVLIEVARKLPGAMSAAGDDIAALDSTLLPGFVERLGRFEIRMSIPELIDTLMAHHETVQGNKVPNGKRAWFDRYGQGWVVRSLYRNPDSAVVSDDWFVHPYRLSSLQTFMKDLAQ